MDNSNRNDIEKSATLPRNAAGPVAATPTYDLVIARVKTRDLTRFSYPVLVLESL